MVHDMLEFAIIDSSWARSTLSMASRRLSALCCWCFVSCWQADDDALIGSLLSLAAEDCFVGDVGRGADTFCWLLRSGNHGLLATAMVLTGLMESF